MEHRNVRISVGCVGDAAAAALPSLKSGVGREISRAAKLIFPKHHLLQGRLNIQRTESKTIESEKDLYFRWNLSLIRAIHNGE